MSRRTGVRLGAGAGKGFVSTILDVVRDAGVSVATVSPVINGTHYVSPELHQRLLHASEALNYRPKRLARALSRKQKLEVRALIAGRIPFEPAAEVYAAIDRGAGGVKLLLTYGQ